MKRGVGYCENVGCEEYLKGTFTMNQDVFHCPRCRVKGFMVLEKYVYSNDFPVVRDVWNSITPRCGRSTLRSLSLEMMS